MSDIAPPPEDDTPAPNGQRGASPAAPPEGTEEVRPIPQVQSVSFEIPISGYQGPMSHGAAAAFKAGARTVATAPGTVSGRTTSLKIALFLAAALGLGLLLGTVAYFFLRLRGAPLLPAPLP